MAEVLEVVFRSGWHFTGTVILIAVTLGMVGYCIESAKGK